MCKINFKGCKGIENCDVYIAKEKELIEAKKKIEDLQACINGIVKTNKRVEINYNALANIKDVVVTQHEDIKKNCIVLELKK